MDTTGVECFVKENNPKFFNALVKRLEYFNKDKSKEDIYKMAYNQMPKTAEVYKNIKLQYINGHFCYAHTTAGMYLINQNSVTITYTYSTKVIQDKSIGYTL